MNSYAEKEVFTSREKLLLRQATELVEIAPYEIDGNLVRCHELARAVGKVLGLEHEDGRYGFVEHTWLWTESLKEEGVPDKSKAFFSPWVLPNVLDVYVPGSVPQVQLVHMAASGLPPRYYLSNLKAPEIRASVVRQLTDIFGQYESNLEREGRKLGIETGGMP
jgi:hypothetical protein